MRKTISKVLLGLAVTLIFPLFALAQDFSADVLQVAAGQAFEGKIFVSKEKTRMETPQAISITRMDKNLIWILMPQEQTYMEQALSAASILPTGEKMPQEIERKLLLLEKIGGRMTEKYRVVYETAGLRAVSFQWIDKETAVMVKSAAEDGSWSMEYRNIKKAPQPDSLFEIPAGYKKFSYGQDKFMGGWE